jgi:selenocysteine-specific elongation factor
MKSIVIGTAGHIDHGKSALVRALTGIDPDRLKEEKARGITIDLGFAHTTIDELDVAFVDVPGHERFVKNMLAGVGGIDLVVLVVAADESVMPQTREHFDICRLLHVPAGLVAITKSDLVDAETLELVRLEVRDLAAGSFLDSAPIVPVSAKTGDGLDTFRRALAAVSASVRGRPVDGVTRLPIDRVFSMKGFGTVVTGTLVSGRVRTDAELTVAPGDRRVKVRGVQVHGAARQEAVAGQRTAVNLGGIDVDAIERGQTLVGPDSFSETRLADAILDVLPGAKALRHGARVRFHQGMPVVTGGSRAFVRLRLERPTVLARGDRYILRAYSPAMTIAGGVILDPGPPRGAIRTEAALERARRLAFDPAASARPEADARAAEVMIEDAGRAGFALPAMVSRVGVEPGALDTTVNALVRSGTVTRAGNVLVSRAIFDDLKRATLAALAEHHRAQPLSEGIPRDELRDRVFARGHAEVFERALSELVEAGTIASRDRIALASHRVALSPEDERARQSIERLFRDAGLKPPDAAAIAAETHATAATVDRVLKLLQRQKVLVRVDTLLFHDEALKQLKAELAALKTSAGNAARIDVATFKERFGVSRKFAIPLLEYLDRERVTRRMGDSRVLL